jgi:hypothetical protein
MRPRSHTLLTSKRDANKTRVVLSHHRPQQQSSGLTSETFPPSPLFFLCSFTSLFVEFFFVCLFFFVPPLPLSFTYAVFSRPPFFFLTTAITPFFFYFWLTKVSPQHRRSCWCQRLHSFVLFSSPPSVVLLLASLNSSLPISASHPQPFSLSFSFVTHRFFFSCKWLRWCKGDDACGVGG